MVNRLLALPAVLCLVAGGLLGAWGWSQRDEARAKIRSAPVVPDDGGFFDHGPDPRSGTGRRMVCDALFDAANLRVPAGGAGLGPIFTESSPSGPSGSSGPSGPSPEEVAAAEQIMATLDPYTVIGVVELEQPEVLSAMADQQAAMRRALQAGRDPSIDPRVLDAASNLELVLTTTC